MNGRAICVLREHWALVTSGENLFAQSGLPNGHATATLDLSRSQVVGLSGGLRGRRQTNAHLHSIVSISGRLAEIISASR